VAFSHNCAHVLSFVSFISVYLVLVSAVQRTRPSIQDKAGVLSSAQDDST